MSEDQPSEVLGALPRTRPHRRSDKRGVRQPDADAAAEPPAAQTVKAASEPSAAPTSKRTRTAPAAATKRGTTAAKLPAGPRTAPKRSATTPGAGVPRLHQPAQPPGTPSRPSRREPAPARGTDIVGTAVQAAAELAEIGLSVTARAVRGAVSKLPRP